MPTFSTQAVARAGVRLGAFLAAALAALGASVGVVGAASGDEDLRFRAHLIAIVPAGIDVDRGIVFTPDARHVAYVGTRGEESVPVIDAQVFDPQWYVQSPRASADGRVAFALVQAPAKRVQVSSLLLDGRRVPGSEGIDVPEFSPDGRRIAYVADPECRIAEDRSRPGPFVLVVDGRKGSKWRGVSQVSWSRDSKHVVAVAERLRGGFCVIVDDKPIAEGARYDGPCFGPDGSRVAYACELPRGKALATDFARIKWFVVCGASRLGLDFDNAGSPVFSPDGRRIAFKAERAGRVGVSVDGAPPASEWSFVTTPVFSPDGTHLAFTASADCEVMPGYRVTTIPGGGVVTGGTWQVVLDGEPVGAKFGAVDALTFSADSRRLAFRARSGERWRVHCGAATSEEFDFVGPPVFSPDGTRVGFGVLRGREFAWKVMVLE